MYSLPAIQSGSSANQTLASCHTRPPLTTPSLAVCLLDSLSLAAGGKAVEGSIPRAAAVGATQLAEDTGNAAVTNVELQSLLAPVTLPSKLVSLAASSSSESLAPYTPATQDVAGRSSPHLAAAAPMDPPQRCAYVTLLTRDNYLMGVQALARSLRAARAKHPLLVMYTADSLSLDAILVLQHEPCQLLAVERYVPAGRHNFGQYKLQLYGECWTKLRMFELEQYDRLAYLDADMLILRNIDHLFSLPPGFYAAPDCSAGRETQAERDACPLFCPRQPQYFNAGFFLMTPSRAELARFDVLLAAGAVRIGAYAEQDMLNEVYKGAWRPLPHTFNAQKGIRYHHPQLWCQHWHEVAVLHYTDAKPWQPEHPENGRYGDLVQLWWRVYEGRADVAL